jgi:hypothetical protein
MKDYNRKHLKLLQLHFATFLICINYLCIVQHLIKYLVERLYHLTVHDPVLNV